MVYRVTAAQYRLLERVRENWPARLSLFPDSYFESEHCALRTFEIAAGRTAHRGFTEYNEEDLDWLSEMYGLPPHAFDYLRTINSNTVLGQKRRSNKVKAVFEGCLGRVEVVNSEE